MKRFLSVVLAMIMILSTAVPAFALSFTDIMNSDYAFATNFLTELKIVHGYEDGTFRPKKIVTRAEVAKLLVCALRLESGADILKEEQIYDDVPTSHWAAGYIAVASQYDIVTGDGDENGRAGGNFRPEDPVDFAEITTMCIRALGYSRVLEKQGQWPTNYISKGNEINLYEDLPDLSANDGSQRDVTIQMIWNMMQIKTWDVVGESEEGGLIYEEGEPIIDKQYPDYIYGEFTFEDYDIVEEDNELKVKLTFEELEDKYNYSINDFYTLVPGTVFETVIHKEDITTMVATEDNILVNGTGKELNEKYDNVFNDADGITGTSLKIEDNDYGYLRVDTSRSNAKILNSRVLSGENSLFVQEIEESGDGFNFTDGIYASDIFEDEDVDSILVLIDGERKTLKDIKLEDVYTEIRDELYIVAREKTSGTMEKFVNESSELTVSGEKYYVIYNSTFAVKQENDDPEVDMFIDNGIDYSIFKEETTDMYLNFLGGVVRLNFEKTADSATDVEGTIADGFFVVASDVWMVSDEDGAEYKIKLINMNGETNTYTFKESIDTRFIYENLTDAKNEVLWIDFDDEDKVTLKPGESEEETEIVGYKWVTRQREEYVRRWIAPEPYNYYNPSTNQYVYGYTDGYYDYVYETVSYDERVPVYGAGEDPYYPWILGEYDILPWGDVYPDKYNENDYGEKTVYKTTYLCEAEYDDGYLEGYETEYYEDIRFKINDDTKLIKLIFDTGEEFRGRAPETGNTIYVDDEGNQSIPSPTLNGIYAYFDVEYSVEIETGKDAFKGLDGYDDVMVASTGEFNTAKYVFVWNDNMPTTDIMFGKVEKAEYNAVSEEYEITLSDENGIETEHVFKDMAEPRYSGRTSMGTVENEESYVEPLPLGAFRYDDEMLEHIEGFVIAYTIDRDNKITIKEIYPPNYFMYTEYVDYILTVSDDNKMAKAIGLYYGSEYTMDLELENELEYWDDRAIVIINVGLAQNAEAGPVLLNEIHPMEYRSELEITSFEQVTSSELEFNKGDLIIYEGPLDSEEVVAIYRLSNEAERYYEFGPEDR